MSEYIKKSALLHWLSLYPHADIPLKMLTYYIDKMQGVGEDAISAEYEEYKKTADGREGRPGGVDRRYQGDESRRCCAGGEMPRLQALCQREL